jgi:hypothetical protein
LANRNGLTTTKVIITTKVVIDVVIQNTTKRPWTEEGEVMETYLRLQLVAEQHKVVMIANNICEIRRWLTIILELNKSPHELEAVVLQVQFLCWQWLFYMARYSFDLALALIIIVSGCYFFRSCLHEKDENYQTLQVRVYNKMSKIIFSVDWMSSVQSKRHSDLSLRSYRGKGNTL